MKKFLWIGGIGLLCLGIAVVFWVDSLARVAVEKAASSALGVPVTLSSLRIGLFSGEAGLSDLIVKNPPGFSGPEFFRLGSGELVLSLGSLFSDRVRIPKIRLRGIDLTLEQAGSQSNLGEILKFLSRDDGARQAQGGEPAVSKAADAQPSGKRFFVEEIFIEEIRVAGTLQVPGLGAKTVSYLVPQIRLNNVGSESAQGASVARLSAEIMKAILQGAIEQGKDLPQEILQEWKSKSRQLREQVQDLKGKADELKGLFRKKKD